MKSLALLFALSLYLLPNPTLSTRNPIRLPTADVAVAADTPVLDTDGDALRAGGTYFITSTGWGALSGGVHLVRIDSTTKCPSDVISEPLLDGDRIRITPMDPNATVVSLSTFQSFSFNVATSILCINSVFWGIRYDDPSGKYFLNSGEFIPNLSGRFKIEQFGNSYGITFCPFGARDCYNIDRYFDQSVGTRRLALGDFPFTVVFKKAS